MRNKIPSCGNSALVVRKYPELVKEYVPEQIVFPDMSFRFLNVFDGEVGQSHIGLNVRNKPSA